ncbi:hypothetical protein FHS55_001576 [Angulomicrobium tetraedrale]|uniref:Uncharacterized protein n=1 Tax=Ancylobacter tetraedralis TaxID=217068 RepID=A0A839Z7C4_9HYPH|nr:hypothetical protein [Ancylobacter tetraedralis]
MVGWDFERFRKPDAGTASGFRVLRSTVLEARQATEPRFNGGAGDNGPATDFPGIKAPGGNFVVDLITADPHDAHGVAYIISEGLGFDTVRKLPHFFSSATKR